MSITIKNDIIYLNDSNPCIENINKIQEFCNNNSVEIESLGYGYAILKINDNKYDITPYGIDIPMMIKFCKL